MKSPITLNLRAIKAPVGSSVDATEAFTEVRQVRAQVKTTRGTQFFDGANLQNGITHEFYIRFFSIFENDIGTSWIEFKSKYYNILDIEVFEEGSRFVKLSCSVRGDKTLSANHA